MPALINLNLPERYLVQNEIARGGMGAVWKVVDTHFNRPLAVKVMLPETASNPEHVQRFQREAQLTGTLQHPAIPPVIDCGLLDDGAPFFSLKLIEGETLGSLLKRRGSPQEDLPRFLGIFEQVSQAVGFAHSLNVIHRDLKPANIMVGEFGEVQVMDWGMAKRLSEIEPEFNPEESTVQFFAEPDSEDLTVTGNSDTHDYGEAVTLTRAGQVLGTLAYMPPEQARGERNELDARADVFALGAILCKILTGEPPYTGQDRMQLYQQVLATDVTEAMDRLETCGADRELIELTKACLQPRPDDRPVDGLQVAEAVRQYEEATRRRLQEEQAERAAAEARTREEKKRKKLVLLLGGLTVLLLSSIGFAGWRYQREQTRLAQEMLEQDLQERQTRTEIVQVLQQAKDLRGRYQMEAATKLLARVESRLKMLASPEELAQQLQEAQRELRLLRELDRIHIEKIESKGFINNNTYGNGPDGDYAVAFRAYGLDVSNTPPVELAEQIRNSSIAEDLIEGLEIWRRHEEYEIASRLEEIVRLAEPAERTALARQFEEAEGQSLETLLSKIDLAHLPPSFMRRLVQILVDKGEVEAAHQLCTSALAIRPSDFWLHHEISQKEFRLPVSLRMAHYRSALAIRPNSTTTMKLMGNSLMGQRRYVEAEQYLRRAIAISPGYSAAQSALANVLSMQQQFRESEKHHRLAIKTDPKNELALGYLGVLLKKQGRLDESEQIFRRAITVCPGYVQGHCYLGSVLAMQKRFEEAEQAYQKALDVNPDIKKTTRSEALTALGRFLERQERFDEAEHAYRKAIEIPPHPRYARPHWELATMLASQVRYEEAAQVYQEAIKVFPTSASLHASLGWLLGKYLHRLEEGEEWLSRAVELDPKNTAARNNLGILLRMQNRYEASEYVCRQAIRIAPDRFKPYANLGLALRYQKRYQEAEEAYRKAIEIDPEYALAYAWQGDLLNELKRFEEAETSYLKAISLNKDDIKEQSRLLNRIAWMLVLNEEYNRAEQHSRHSLELTPQEPNKVDTLAWALIGQKKLNEALHQHQWDYPLELASDE